MLIIYTYLKLINLFNDVAGNMGKNLLNLHLKTCKLIQYVGPIDKLEHLHKKSTRQYLYSSQ